MLNKIFTIIVIMSFSSLLLSGEVTKSSDKEKSKIEKLRIKEELNSQKNIDTDKERPNKIKSKKIDSDKRNQIRLLRKEYKSKEIEVKKRYELERDNLKLERKKEVKNLKRELKERILQIKNS